MHRRVSPLTWIGETQLAFVDEAAGVFTAVIADVAAGVSRPIVKTQILDLAAGEGRFTIDNLTRLPDRNGVMVLQLKLRTQSESRTVEIFMR
jgi:hypothetical protein